MSNDEPLRASVAADLGSLAAGFAAPRAAPAELASGTVVGGHFVVEAALGRGGMGAVYRAHDRTLDRHVALKLGLGGTDLARARREAVALARLAHPNVVTIHEIGEHNGVPFVAMELCEGGSVRAWTRAARRPWRDVLAVFVAAGRGLAAAHAAGLVHRDVKPDNILLGGDGRARIADFGLARGAAGLVGAAGGGGGHAGGAAALDWQRATTVAAGVTSAGDATVPAPELTPPSLPSPDTTLTAAGAIVGTPRYMAPEQLDGGAVDARSDQFAFCVALYEAVAGVDPFPAVPAARAAAMVAGQITPPARERHVPRRVLAVVARGLAGAPSARFASMDALLEALTRAARRRRWWLAPAAAVVAVAIATPWWLAGGGAAPPGCAPPAARLRGVWDASIRGELAARSVGGAGFVAAIDARVARWTELRATTCRQVGRGGELAAAGFARLQCLEQRLADTVAVVGHARADAGDLGRAAVVAGELIEVDACREGRALDLHEPQPATAELRARVTAERATLRVASALGNTGQLDAALALLAGRSARGAFPPLEAEVDYGRAAVLGEQGDADASKRAYRSAIATAAAANHPRVQISAQLDLAFALARDGGDLDTRAREEITGMLELAEATLRGAGDDPELRAHVLGNRAAVRAMLGDHDGAIADARDAYRMRVALAGADSATALNAAHTLGTTLLAAGHARDAQEVLAPALVVADARFPPTHSIVRALVDQLANATLRLSDLAAARALRERSLELTATALGPDSAKLDGQRLGLSSLLAAEGKFREGIPLLEATLASRHRRGDDTSAAVARLHGNLAMSYSLSGRLDQAVGHGEQAVTLLAQALGDEHPALIQAHLGLAMIYFDRGEAGGAATAARRGVTLARATLAADSPRLANPLATLAMIIAAEQPAEARQLAEQARALAAPPDGNPAVRGEAELALAMALAGLGQPARAVAMAEHAAATLTAAGPMAASSLDRATAWLAAQRAR